MLIPSTFTDFLLSNGRSLAEINEGSDEIALRPPKALEAILLLAGSQVAVLGGDVLSDASGKLSYTHENWYCEHTQGESPLAFVKRSHQVAKEFIAKLIERNGNDNYVVLVYSELGLT